MQDEKRPAVIESKVTMSHFDSTGAIWKSRADHLAALLGTGKASGKLWRTEELSSIFKHQMQAPLAVDLASLGATNVEQGRGLEESGSPKSFGDLLADPTPPMELLKLTKDFAKANRDHPESGLPREIALALYYLSIAAGLVRLRARLTELSDADLLKGLKWAHAQEWLDEGGRSLLVNAIASLGGSKT